MTLVEGYQEQRRARLIRLGAVQERLPVPKIIPQIVPFAWDAGFDGMWFHDLVSLRAKPPSQISVKDIQIAVAEHYGVNVRDILAHRRTADIAMPRHIAMYLTKKLTGRSMPDIGRLFGRRDHTTVLHACRKIAALVETDSAVFASVTNIRRRFI